MRRLIWGFAGRTYNIVGNRGSNLLHDEVGLRTNILQPKTQIITHVLQKASEYGQEIP